MWTFDQQVIALVPGTDAYALPVDTVDLMDAVIRTGTGATQSDIAISRISLPTYQTIPNKTVQGRPIQLCILRTITPEVRVWPVPDSSTPYTLVYWRLRRIQDAGTGVNTQDLPFRFLPALVAGLAYYLGMKRADMPMDRLAALKLVYDDVMQAAQDEDREKAPLRLVPSMGYN